MSDPSTCGCCSGITAETPAEIANRPGLSVIAYRSGTWSQFKESMLDALSTQLSLAGLRTRSDDDFTVALLDAWAVVCDILTFYQERIATESYLRTATELVSIGELAKLIGYKLRPGVAASVALSFAVSVPLPAPKGPSTPPDGGPPEVVLAVGTKAQSIPDPDQQAATFETIAAISARAEWTAIALRPTAPPKRSVVADITLSGLTGLPRVGDTVLLIAGHKHRLQRVTKVVADTVAKTTLVKFGGPSATPAGLPNAPGTFPSSARLNDAFVRGSVKKHVWTDQTVLVANAVAQNWSVDDLEDAINGLRTPLPGHSGPIRAYAMGVDAALYGHNAPNWTTLPSLPTPPANWENITLQDAEPGAPLVDLDSVYPAAVAGGQVVFVDPTSTKGLHYTRVVGAKELTRSDYLIAAKVTRLQVDSFPVQPSSFGLRTTQILASTAHLAVTEIPLTDPAGAAGTGLEGAGQLMLDGAYLSLAVGQSVAVSGVRTDKAGATGCELLTIKALSLVDGYTVISFSPEMTGTYVRSTVTIDANVAAATHGETRFEILGSGDSSQTFQRFPLKQTPLTYVAANTPSGVASTLLVRVDGVQWSEVPWLYSCAPTDRVYTVVVGADGTTYVQFGDGVTGARPGSGTNNVQATYRQGIGSAGTVRAGQISMLLSRPPGVGGVINSLASNGASDPETIDQARPNAPISVRTIDRIVSLEDFGDFAAASAGIGKAAASWIWDGTSYVAAVTVAGINGAAVVPNSDQYNSLLSAMRSAGDGTVSVTLCPYTPLTFTLAAAIIADPTLDPAAVLSAVKAALAQVFCFAARAFGQPVFQSEVITTIQNVPGVVAVTLSVLDQSGYHGLRDMVPSPPPTRATNPPGGLIGASLLILENGPLPAVVIAR